jgi:hypothetical protein
VGTVFARVSYTVSALIFGPFRGLYNSRLPWCYIGLTTKETRTRNWFPIRFRKVAVPSVRIEVDFCFLIPYRLVAIISCLPHQEPTRRGPLSRNSPLSGCPLEPLAPLRVCTPQRTTLYHRSSFPFLGPFLIRRRCRVWPHHWRCARPEFGNWNRCLPVCRHT